MELSIQELQLRKKRFISKMNLTCPDWDSALVISKVNQLYFTGTMQDGLVLIQKNGELHYFVHRSLERARQESLLEEIHPMPSFRNAAERVGKNLGNTYLEADVLPYNMVQRLQKYFTMKKICNLDPIVRQVRAVKSPYELEMIRMTGAKHQELFERVLPSLLQEGMSEAELVGRLWQKMLEMGHQGQARFFMFQTEISMGQYGFGANSLFPTSFDGPGGGRGNSAASPVGGDPGRRLQKGDIVFADNGFGIRGYHTDKTQVYRFDQEPSQQMQEAQQLCIDIETQAAKMLVPGAIPSEIYQTILQDMTDAEREHFMGTPGHQVKFLGHGVGLQIDELPVLAKGFDQPLELNMVLAIEPKKSLPGIGTVGVEDTYIVTPTGGECVTGGGREIIKV